MKLTEEDKQRIVSWISDKCGPLKCTCCGGGNKTQWSIAEASNVLLGFDLHSTRFHYHEGTTMVNLICSNCGYMLAFNPGIMGFKPDVPDAPVETVSEDENDTGSTDSAT